MCTEGARVYNAAWRSANPGKVAEYEASKDRDRVNENARARYATNPEPKKISARKWLKNNPLTRWAYTLRYHYGMTPEQWTSMFEAQGRRCAICGTTSPGKRSWAVDHDHETRHVRGILCHACNLLLGRLWDTVPAVLESCRRMLQYLESSAVSRG